MGLPALSLATQVGLVGVYAVGHAILRPIVETRWQAYAATTQAYRDLVVRQTGHHKRSLVGQTLQDECTMNLCNAVGHSLAGLVALVGVLLGHDWLFVQGVLLEVGYEVGDLWRLCSGTPPYRAATVKTAAMLLLHHSTAVAYLPCNRHLNDAWYTMFGLGIVSGTLLTAGSAAQFLLGRRRRVQLYGSLLLMWVGCRFSSVMTATYAPLLGQTPANSSSRWVGYAALVGMNVFNVGVVGMLCHKLYKVLRR